MKKLLKFMGSRMFITGILILLQIGWLLVWYLRLTQYAQWISALFSILGFLAAVFIINKNENPAYKLAWILTISVFPALGGLLYLSIGNKRPTRRMRKRLEEEQAKRLPLHLQKPDTLEALEMQDPRAAASFRYVWKKGRYPVWTHTKTQYYTVGEELFRAMLEELEKAEHYIFLEYFILAEGSMWSAILEILERKVQQGVDVRVIYDDFGCLGYIPAGYDRKLEKKGIHCIAFNPFVPVVSAVMNNRDHRKIMVIDGHVAFSGGVNIGDEYINQKLRFGHWKDTGFRLEGEGVWNMTLMFLEMWNAFRPTDETYEAFYPNQHHLSEFESDGFVQPFSDSPLDDETLAETVYMELLAQATDYVYIFTPYLVIDNEMQTALCTAAKRGVDVRLVTPGIPDKKMVFRLTRSHYQPLLEAGVRIYEYSPGFLHAKSFVCDDKLAVVGTINMDYRSLYLHFECGTLFYGSQLISQLKEDALHVFEVSSEVKRNESRRPNLFKDVGNAILRVLAPLL
ncbi:MAG: cardiolipin synthase [Firmicutes bacterium]|nr:cardiolipin synthase [Bacillota bacterium]